MFGDRPSDSIICTIALVMLLILFALVVLGCQSVPDKEGGGRSGGLLSIFKGAGGFVSKAVIGEKAPTAPPPSTGLCVFTYTGGIGLLAVLIMLVLERKLRVTLFIVAASMALVPWVAYMIEPAANLVVSIGATIVGAGMCIWAILKGIDHAKARKAARLKRDIVAEEAKRHRQ